MSINFQPVVVDVSSEMANLVKYILSLDISPEVKKTRIATAFKLVGSDFYYQMFEAGSELFDSLALKTADFEEMTDQLERLSVKIVRNDALSREVEPLVKDFYDSALGKAQAEAFRNAVSMEKAPTLTRTLVGETCEWCRARQGTFIDPEGDDFARHRDCDCLLVVSGFNSRNGVLNNYVKKKGETR